MNALTKTFERIAKRIGHEVVTTRELIGLVSDGRFDRSGREIGTAFREARMVRVDWTADGEPRYRVAT